MHIYVSVFVYAPSDQIWLGGSNPPLTQKIVTCEMTPTLLEEIIRGFVQVEGIRCRVLSGYKASDNTVLVSGNLPCNGPEQVLKVLESRGWLVNWSAWDSYTEPWAA